jgi:hypothetical protein
MERKRNARGTQENAWKRAETIEYPGSATVEAPADNLRQGRITGSLKRVDTDPEISFKE